MITIVLLKTLYIFVSIKNINKNKMAVKTKNTLNKEKRNEDIKKAYLVAMSDPGSQKFAVYEQLSLKHKVSTSSIARIVGNLKSK